jgi:PAS domain S-box-containing protein
LRPGANERATDLERELGEIREREAAYRLWLTTSAERTERLHDYSLELLKILGSRPPTHHDLVHTLTATARISSRALEVTRTSLWLLNEKKAQLECRVLVVGEQVQPTERIVLPILAGDAYVKALRENGVVAVEDVHRDPRTRGLEAYCELHGVTALLDISVHVAGELAGVVCHEHTAGPRAWHPAEIDFATHVGNLFALALEVERRHAAEAKAENAEARYRYLVESLPVTVYSFDPYTQSMQYLSPQFREFGWLEADELLARGMSAWLGAVDEADRPLVQARFAPHSVNSLPAEIEYRVHLPAAGERYVRDRCRVVRNHAGDPVAIQGVLTDITEQRKTQVRAAEFERRLSSLLQHVELIAGVLDAEGKVEFVNACFERTTGYEAAQVLGQDGIGLLAAAGDAARLQAVYQQLLRSGSLLDRVETDLVCRNGERRRVVWASVRLYADDGTVGGACLLGVDITERVRREEALAQQTKLESLGQLAAGIAHDFNNLLTIVGGQVEILAALQTDTVSQSAVTMLRDAWRHATELTRSLLVYARREVVRPVEVDVDGIVAEMMPLLSAMAQGEIRVTTALQSRFVRVLIDPAQLRQLLINLVSNALDATRHYGDSVHVTTAVEFLAQGLVGERRDPRAGRYVVLCVSDDGRGMDARTLARVFEPFFTTKAPGRGTGLGVPICQSITEDAGGFMRVQSELDKGTTIRVYLPVVSGAEPMRLNLEPSSRVISNEPRVLVVAQDAGLRRLLVGALDKVAPHVWAVDSMTEALRVAAREPFDLLVADGNLPDGSGRTLAQMLRAARPHTRVLLVADAPVSSSEFDGVLHKPVTEDAVRLAAKRLLVD